jgi:hypothetical protein
MLLSSGAALLQQILKNFRICKNKLGLDVFTPVVTTKGYIFWHITPCSLFKVNRRAAWLLVSRCFFACFILIPWRWRWHIPPKRRYTFNRLHGSRYRGWLLAGRPRCQSSSPGRVKNFLFSTSSISVLESTQPPTQWVSWALSPEVKRPGREADDSLPATAEVKKMWIYTSTPPYAFMT